MDVECDTSPQLPAVFSLFPFVMILSGRVVPICGVVRLTERFVIVKQSGPRRMSQNLWTLYKKINKMGPKAPPMHFNKIKKQDA
jgi:hypothetical protein